ncbi:MAG: PqqD family peptide modification chaperone [Planctomycetes bacterium]|nr:PqqD family peptide modification chaperone [Planctomycetota bacterium]
MTARPLTLAPVRRDLPAVPPPPPRDTPAPAPTERLADGLYLVHGARHAALYDVQRGAVHWVEAGALAAAERGDALLVDLLGRGRVGAGHLPEAMRAALLGRGARRPEALPVGRSRRLRFLWIELSAGCNLACTHCYASSGGEHRSALTTEGYARLLDDAAAVGCEMVQLTGGEPLLHPDLLPLIDRARGLGLEVELYTNLALLTDDLALALAARGVSIATSFYSDRAADHEAVTRVAGSFEATVDGIRRALARQIPLRVGVILQGGGYERRDETLAFLVGLGVDADAVRFDEVRPEGRGVADAVPPGPPSGGQDSCSHAPQRAFTRWVDVNDGLVRGNNCWGGELNVTARGEVVPCIFERKLAVGHVDADGAGLTALATGERARAVWSITLEECRVCRDCEFRYACFDCRFSTYRATGDLYAKPPGCTYDPHAGRYEEDPGMPPGAPRRREDLIVEEVEDGLVALDEARGEAHALNATAAAVWELLDGRRDVAAVAGIIADVTGAAPDRVLADVEAAVADLAARGLLQA